MKKLLSLVLSAVLMLSCAFSVGADSPSADDYALQVAVGLGLIEEQEDYSRAVDRAGFSTIVLKVYNLGAADPYAEGVDTPFLDVSEAHYKSADILKAYTYGILNGYENGYFCPEAPLTLSECTKVIMDALGYRDFVVHSGGYPKGYLAQASKLGLFKGIDAGQNDSVSYYVLAQILYNALSVDVVSVSEVMESRVSFDRQKGTNFLALYHDIYAGEGIVTDNGITRTNGTSRLQEGRVEIDGTVFSAQGLTDCLGLTVEYYYKAGDSVYELCYAIPKKNRNEVITISGDDIVSCANNRIVYTNENDKEVKASVPDNGNVLYNGLYKSKIVNFDLTALFGLNGTVTLSDGDGDGNFELIRVTEYKNDIISNIIKDKKMLLLKNSNHISFDDNSVYGKITKGGKVVSVNELENGSLVSIAASENFNTATTDRKYVEIVVADANIQGTVSSLISGTEAVITSSKGIQSSQEAYKISPKFVSENGAVLQVGSKGVFWLDACGKIGYFTGDLTAMDYGYIIESGTERGLAGNYKIKMMTSDGEIKILETADSVWVDGVKKSRTSLDSLLEQTADIAGEKGQLVRYALNIDGCISKLDTLSANIDGDSGEITRKEITLSGGLTYKGGSKSFVTTASTERYLLDDTTKVFIIPVFSGHSDDDFLVRSSSYFQDKTYATSTSGEKLFMYNVDEGTPKVIVLQLASAVGNIGGINQYSDDMAVIMRKYQTVNNEGEECTGLTVMITNTVKDIILNSDKVKILRLQNDSLTDATALKENGTALSVNDLDFGDLILYDEDKVSKTVSTILKMNDYKIPDCTSNGSVKYGIQNPLSYLERLRGSVRKINKNKFTFDVSDSTGYLYVNVIGSIQIYLVDTLRKSVSVATTADIIYSDDDTLADKVFMRTRNGAIKQIVIYR